MQNDRRCIKCGEPLIRKAGESHGYFADRKFCSRACYAGNRSAKPIWMTFQENTIKRENGCIEWQGYADRKGYGRFSTHGGEVLCHRIAYAIHFGANVAGKQVLHRCDNRLCCNPQHLFLGTHKDNMADMVRKGRSPKRFGQQNPNYRHGKNCVANV